MKVEYISALFLLSGSLFMLISSIGLLRFPDLYMRINSTTKASTMGILLSLIGVCAYMPEWLLIVKSCILIIYIFMTTPVASQMIGHAGHLLGVPKWEKTFRDDLETDHQKKPESD